MLLVVIIGISGLWSVSISTSSKDVDCKRIQLPYLHFILIQACPNSAEVKDLLVEYNNYKVPSHMI